MIFRLITTSLLSLALLTATVSGTSADIKVNPKPKDAAVLLEAGKRTPQDPRPGQFPGRFNSIGNKPTYEPITACREDAELGIYGCRDTDPAEPAEELELTPGDVLREVKEIGLPSLQVNVQPGGQTLVNVDTIFYAEPQPFERSVELLGFDVDLVAEPESFQWFHGDGSTHTTQQPGRPYPAMDVTHRYETPADDVQARVDVTYRVRFRVDGGPWQSIGQTLEASGPAAVLDVREAAPVLSRP